MGLREIARVVQTVEPILAHDPRPRVSRSSPLITRAVSPGSRGANLDRRAWDHPAIDPCMELRTKRARCLNLFKVRRTGIVEHKRDRDEQHFRTAGSKRH